MPLQIHDIIVPAASAVIAVGGTILTFKIKQVKIDEHMTSLEDKVGGVCKSVDHLRKDKANESYADDLAKRINKLDDDKVAEKTCEKCQDLNRTEHRAIIKGQDNINTTMHAGFERVEKAILDGKD